MNELEEIRQLLESAAGAMEDRCIERGQPPDSPMQTAEALRTLLGAFDEIDAGQTCDDELAEHALLLAAELVDRAVHLELPHAKSDLENIAVGIALWVARHDGEIRELETVVNGFAASANTTSSDEALRALFHAMKAVLEHAAPSIQADLDQSNPGRPWRVLNFNYAIVATRTQDAQLMTDAFDAMSRNLPHDAPAFFEEGLKQSDKPVYGPVVKSLMQEYFSRWAVRH